MEIYRDLTVRFPDRTESWIMLHGTVAALSTNLTRNGAAREAESLLRQLLGTDRARDEDPPELLVARIDTLAVLGRALEASDRLAEAEQVLRSAGERSVEFRRAWPAFPDWGNILSRPDARLASVLRRQGRLDEALATAQKSFDQARATAATPATSVTSHEELSRQAIQLAEITCQREDPEAFAAIAGDRARLRAWLSDRPGFETLLEAWGEGPKR
jgi:tetratricopeptide (TPR) repeat protein